MKKDISLGNLYDFNKSLVKDSNTLTDKEIKEKKEMIRQFYENSKKSYYMLLCREQNDYTVFSILEEGYEKLEDVFIDCLENRGQIKDIHLTEKQDAIEAWITVDDEAYCYYFFDYTNGVVEVC